MTQKLSMYLFGLLMVAILPNIASSNQPTANNGLSFQLSDNRLLTEEDYLNPVPIILTATRLSQPINTAPASVTIVSREMIEASGAQEIGDLLRLVPGFQVGYFNGTSMSLTYHGFTGNYDRRLQVLIDGRSAYMPFLSTVEWLSLPLDISEVEKIEVIRSSNAPAYGANAIQGVINIITRKPFEEEGMTLEGRWGTHDITGLDGDVLNSDLAGIKNKLDDRKYLLKYANSTKNLDYRVTLGYQKDLGFDEVSDTKKLNLLHLSSSYQLNARDVVDFQIGARKGDMHTFADGSVEDPTRNKSVDSEYQSITWSRTQASDRELKVSFYHNSYYQNDETRITESDNFPFPYSFGIYYGRAERFDAEVVQTIAASDSLRFIFGLGFRLDRIKSKYLLGTAEYISDQSERIFSNVEWYLTKQFVVNGGVMFEHNQQIGSYYSPRLAANYIASRAHVFRASVTRSVRTPSILENNVDVGIRTDEGEKIYTLHISKTNLKPERQYSAEIGYMFSSPTQDMVFDSKIFREYLRDGILEAADYDLPGAPWVWGNNTWANIQGIESQFYYKPNQRFFFNLSHSRTSATANWHKYDNRTDGAKPANDNVSNSVPKDTFAGLFSYMLTPKLTWSFTYYYMTEMRWIQDGNIVKEHDRLDTKINWQKKISSNSNLNISLVFQNMLNDYVEIQDETIFKQRAYLNIRFKW